MSALLEDVQTVDAGMSRAEIETRLAACGYWGTKEDRERYRFTLSPSVYVISPSQRDQLERLATTTHAAVRKLNARLCDIGRLKSPATHEDGRLVSLANAADRSLLRPKDAEYGVPPIIKVDLVQDACGNYFIVEVDAYNPRGVGYIAMLETTLREEFLAKRYPGTRYLADLLRARACGGDPEWYFVISEFERFYATSFAVFARAMARSGITVHLVLERDLLNQPGLIPEAGANIILIPDTLNTFPAVREELMARYRAGRLNPLFPPVAYLGSKAFLPYLRMHDGMKEFIPPTALVGKRCGDPREVVDLSRPAVLKATVSSGMKGVYFSDMDEGFEERLTDTSRFKNPAWILQQQIAQTPVPVTVFEECGRRVTRDYFLRVTAYVSSGRMVDVEVTGRPDRKVHGAPDCIQLPTVFA